MGRTYLQIRKRIVETKLQILIELIVEIQLTTFHLQLKQYLRE